MKRSIFFRLSMLTLIIVSVLCIFPARNCNAQNLGKQYIWLKTAPTELQTSGSGIYYNMSIKPEGTYTKEELENNAARYFKELFSTELFKKEKGTYTGMGTYKFSLANADDVYEVNYILDITPKKGRYEMTMRNVTIKHFDTEVDIVKRIKTAAENDDATKNLCVNLHKMNIAVLKKIYDVMDYRSVGDNATAIK